MPTSSTVTCNHFRFLRLRFQFGSASWTCSCPFDFCSGNFKITKTARILLLSLLNFLCVTLKFLCTTLWLFGFSISEPQPLWSCTLPCRADGTGNEVVIHSLPASQAQNRNAKWYGLTTGRSSRLVETLTRISGRSLLHRFGF